MVRASPRRHALLVEGAGVGGPGLAAVAEVLRAGGDGWEVRRVGADRPAARGELDGVRAALADALALDVDRLLVVVCGAVAITEFAPMRATHAAIVALAERGAGVTGATLVAGLGAYAAAIATAGEVDAALMHLVAGLRGAANDPRLGAISLTSLAAHMAAIGGAARLPDDDDVNAAWIEPPSIDQLWYLGEAPAAAAPAPATSAGDPLVGVVLPGRFRVEARIAEGSFGAIYRGRQIAVDRAVAIKVARAEVVVLSEDARLFVDEIRAVARIDHANVVRVYQADLTADGRLFFAMEWLSGGDLGTLGRAGTCPPARAVALGRQLLDALEAAHQAGLVHADVKPGNAIVVGERLVLVDFGLARFRHSDGAAASLGGTPAFMAPEQLRAGLVDHRSDQFAAALVIAWLLTGWHRRRAAELVPGADVLGAVADPVVRAALTRALAITPAERFPSAAAFAAALIGEAHDAPPPPLRPPFHGLAALTEADRAHLHGRDGELARLTDLIFHRALVVVTAPSGVGKTSLLRAGLVPRLAALRTNAHYVSCRTVDETRAAATIRPGAATLADALAGDAQGAVVILDQIEDVLDGDRALLDAAVAEAGRGTRIVLSVREDFLARLLDRLPDRGDGAPIIRVGPLAVAGARDAIVRPLAMRRLAIEPALLEQLLADLVAAGQQLGRELGWSVADPVYPPHLQLACSVLYDRLPAEAATLTLALYRAAGGFDEVVGEHLPRVLDRMAPAEARVARELLLALVSSGPLRAARTEDDLAATQPAVARSELDRMLEALRREGVVVRACRPDGEPVWELIHDSLVPRVRAWLDLHDHARRRAMELVRHHLRRGPATVLSRAELRELDARPGLVDALDREWQAGTRGPGGPAVLVARSRTLHRRSRAAAVALGVVVVAGLGAAAHERLQLNAETARRDRNVGRVALAVSAYDWDAADARAVPVAVAALPELTWRLHRPSFDDADQPGELLPADQVRRLSRDADGLGWADTVEAPGGAAVLVVTGRGRPGERCAPSVIPLRALPGYAQLTAVAPRLSVRVPTCQASLAETIEIPAGPFVFGGPGEPPSPYQMEFPERSAEVTLTLPGYRIDRTEVTNATFAEFAALVDATGIVARSYVDNSELAAAGAPRSPVTSTTWREAAVYCRYLGKRLPTSAEWEKAMRGGLTVAGAANPQPRRNFPWGVAIRGDEAHLRVGRPTGPQPVDAFPADVSPYGVVGLAGNVMEWIGSPPTGKRTPTEFFRSTIRLTRGGNWSETPPEDLVNYAPIENARLGDTRSYAIGWRCVSARAR